MCFGGMGSKTRMTCTVLWHVGGSTYVFYYTHVVYGIKNVSAASVYVNDGDRGEGVMIWMEGG